MKRIICWFMGHRFIYDHKTTKYVCERCGDEYQGGIDELMASNFCC